MIDIKYNPSNLTLSINGHAGYAEEGKDIVCSAVSILFYTLVANINQDDTVDVKKQIGKGYSYVKCIPLKETRERIEIVFETIVSGLLLLAEGYPEHVSLEIEEDQDNGKDDA